MKGASAIQKTHRKNKDQLQRQIGAGQSVFCYIIMALCTIVALFPILWVVLSSFKSNKEILSGQVWPSSFLFTGYEQALRTTPIMKFFFNSLLVAGASTIINVFVVAMAAYIFARVTFKHKQVFYMILMSSMVIPTTALIFPVYQTINILHLTDTKMGLILVYSALGLPMSLIILRGFFLDLPKSIEEAAYVDGAGFMRTFLTIILPIARPGLISAGVIQFLEMWNEFTYALVLTSSEDTRTLPLALSYFTSQFSFNYTAMFAAITMAVIPSILIFALFQEKIVSSMITGAVKG